MRATQVLLPREICFSIVTDSARRWTGTIGARITRSFPAIEAAHPDLAPVLRALEQDHSMMAHLIGGLQAAVDAQASPEALARHLEGLAALMESHFRYEERQLLVLLDALELDATPESALGNF